MNRRITGFHLDDEKDWVAELDCGHGHHVRHQPPFFQRPWVESDSGRRSKLGFPLNCVRCEDFELPPDFHCYRKTPIFDQETIPKGLRKAHRTKTGVWAQIHCLTGRLKYVVEPPLARSFEIDKAEPGIIVPEVFHWIEPLGEVTLFIAFYRLNEQSEVAAR